MIYKSILISLLCLLLLSDALVIYRKKQKPRLICHEENSDVMTSSSSESADGDGVVDQPSLTSEPVKNSRVKRSQLEPVIMLDGKIDLSKIANEEDFEIVGEGLSAQDKQLIKRKLVETCRNLNIFEA